MTQITPNIRLFTAISARQKQLPQTTNSHTVEKS